MKSLEFKKSVFFPTFLLVLGAGILGLINNQILISTFKAAFEWSYTNLSWLFQLIYVIVVVLCLILIFSKKGNIRFGGEKAKSKYPFWQWFAMSLTGGIGATIVSSGIAQPITFLQNIWGELDGYGIEPGSSEAILFALGRSFHEWTFIPYAIYGVCGVCIGYTCFNKKQSLSLANTIVPILGKKAGNKVFSSIFDCLAVLALALGTVGTLGTFIGLVTKCLESVYAIPRSILLMFGVMLITTILYLCSSLSGVDRGIRFFAGLNFKFYVFLMVIVVVLGGSLSFMLNTTVSSIGYWLDNIGLWLFDTGTAGGAPLVKWWTIYTWAFWIAYAPVTGVFLAQLAYGRTIKEFLFVNWIMPSLFAILWFGIFGGCAINWQLTGVVDLAVSISSGGTYVGIWEFLKQLPLSFILVPITLFTMLISFTTSADNGVTVISALCMKGRKIGDEAPSLVKILWGGAIGLLSFLLMAYASGAKGNDGVRYMVIAMGSVLALFIVLQIASTIKMLFVDKTVNE